MKKGILIVSFGTSYPETRKKCIESVENRIKSDYAEYEVRRAFTSNMIIKKLKERDNMFIDTPLEALEKMANDGFEQVVVQPLHIIPGHEYEKIKRAVSKINHKKAMMVTLGEPLLYSEADYRETIKALDAQMPTADEKTGVIYMGHGSDHFANASYCMLERMYQESRPNVYFANVEGYPELDDILEDVTTRYDRFVLMPFMLVAGDHASNDMAGDDEDSWKTVLQSEGKDVTCLLQGLGENTLIAEAFSAKVGQMLK